MHRKLQKILLFPFTLFYGPVIWIRNMLFDKDLLKSTSFELPVISVGNITVGGTGKTPHIEYLVQLLKDNYSLAVLSRGYMRKTRDFQIVTPENSVRTAGDEALQVKRKYPDITVAVDTDRVHGVKEILGLDPDTDVILLDDAYQHRYIRAGLSILLIDYNRPVYKDCLLPAGRLREHPSSVKRADIVLLTKSPTGLGHEDINQVLKKLNLMSGQHAFITGLSYDEPRNIFTGEKEGITMDHLAGSMVNVLLVTGIADPSALLAYLDTFKLCVKHLRFPDHHPYSKRDYEYIKQQYLSLPERERCMLTTEKDAIRLNEIMREEDFADDRLFYLGIKIIFPDKQEESEFNKLIKDYVKKNRRNGSLS
ncbi:MAG: tetraacyldisaccharide 4'-kinase [Bacteroidales bacterium]|jgi:tetraacyldisaccharide 4'-kinase|nr:tetraacyldisaccharide 4'-kinase [Bacteroidales bacterium]